MRQKIAHILAILAFALGNASAAVTSLTLVNADNEADIQTITEGDVINLATLPSTNLNIRADVDSTPANVAFALSGATTRSQTESVAPYALWGDSSGNYNAGSLNVGAHTLSATPSGGSAYTVNFTVLNNATGHPTVDAGTDKFLILPANSITLVGSAADDGTIVSYEWTQQSGPNTAGLSGQSSASLSASGLIVGTYVMRLTVTDNDGNSAFDEVGVIVSDGSTQDGVYLEENGLVIMEMERTESPLDLWVEKTAVPGYTEEGYLEFTGNSPISGPVKSPLEFEFRIETPGLYLLDLHCARETLVISGETRNDVANDCYVRVEGDYGAGPNSGNSNGDDAPLSLLQSDTKFYGGNDKQFVWASGSRLDPGGHNNKRVAIYDFKAGETYKLVVSGRSQYFKINRIMFRHKDVNSSTARNLNNPESTRTTSTTDQKKIAYIYGDVAANGTIPSGSAAPYDQMLLDDTGSTGCSEFKAMVEAEGYIISQHYDAETPLSAAFLNEYDVVIFGLHQKLWTAAEKTALDAWLRAGGGALFYSDSAAGGLFSTVGAQNPVGQTAVNNVIAPYGMEVLVDQANGVKAYRAGPEASHPIVSGRPVFEGEGVSPVAVDPASDAIVLIPYVDDPDYKVSGNPTISHTQNLTIANPQYAALAMTQVEEGRLMVMFDRQPMWNDGPGSDIEKRDNREVLRRMVTYLADDAVSSTQGIVQGELKKWHKVTVLFDGPDTSESATPNPFLDYRLDVTFTHPGSGKSYIVPGYYAADGNAAETSADSGNKWAVHFSPDETGTWNYEVSFRTGTGVAVAESSTAGSSAGFCDGESGSFNIAASDKTGRDHRGKGRLQYVGEHYLRFAETGEYFIKQGADSPENLLAYEDFDNTPDIGDRLKSWSPHAGDWNSGDPSWQGGKGTELIGAVNYLASEGMNAMSFLTNSADGDDKNVFMWHGPTDYQRYDVSKCEQWEVIFEHMDKKGIYLHFKTQETENDQKLDGGALGTDRKLYYRELIARFGHHLALNWNIGEENTNTDQQRKDFAQFFHDHDPYGHHLVVHTYPQDKNSVYTPLLGNNSKYTGVSLQTGWSAVDQDTEFWVKQSAAAGKKWVVANDEQGSANDGIKPDSANDHDGRRKETLWGCLMSGGAGNEYYFGYNHAESDLTCQDFRSRDLWWDYCRYAREFFTDNNLPVQVMLNDNSLSSNSNDYCFYWNDEVYVVYLRNGGSTNLDLSAATGSFEVKWFDPRNGGNLQNGSITSVTGGTSVSLGTAPNATSEDWAILVRRNDGSAHVLTVNSGSGDGSYAAGSVVEIVADPAPQGQVFDQWTGDTATIVNPNLATTTLIMPSAPITVTATYADPPDVQIAINCGGPSFTAADGTNYSADQYFSGGTPFTSGDAISGTTDDTLYKSERYGTFSYEVPVSNGSYDVLLQFAEIYQTSDGQRIFDVLIEGSTVVSELDIHAEVGHDAAYETLISNVEVSDSFLTITMSASLQNPKLSAFRILSAETDYEVWAALYPDADLSDPDGDHDGDGASNRDERIFGIDPTSGASADPITVPLDPVAGTFSYTRRDNALTGLTYSIWTSIQLGGWTEDTGAIQTAGTPDTQDVEEVEVTLSPALLENPSLFMYVNAE